MSTRRSVAIVVLAAAMMAVAASAQQPASSADAAELERLERALVHAISTADLAAYDKIVAEDYVAVRADGTETTKAQVMEGYRSGTAGYRDLQIANLRVHIYGDTAVVTARTSGFRRDAGADVPNIVQYVRVFARRGGAWRAVAHMSTPVPIR